MGASWHGCDRIEGEQEKFCTVFIGLAGFIKSLGKPQGVEAVASRRHLYQRVCHQPGVNRLEELCRDVGFERRKGRGQATRAGSDDLAGG